METFLRNIKQPEKPFDAHQNLNYSAEIEFFTVR